MTDPTQMTPEEMDAAIVREIHGWTLRPSGRGSMWVDVEDVFMGFKANHCPSLNIEDAFAAEAEIERRGMMARYMSELWRKSFQSGPDYKTWWALAHASAMDRCLAMLATVRAAKELEL